MTVHVNFNSYNNTMQMQNHMILYQYDIHIVLRETFRMTTIYILFSPEVESAQL